jgi:predicted ATPase
MQVKRFRASRVHGYLDFDIKFFDDLTFITGINGSGKTTALNAIQALLAPDLRTLANVRYERLEVEVEHDASRIVIVAQADERGYQLSTSHAEASISVARYVPDPDTPLHRQTEAEAEHYQELWQSSLDHPVCSAISSLPTPMFLGIDRRSRFEADARRARLPSTLRAARVGRNTFGHSLSASLYDAADLIASKYRSALIASGRIGEELQRELLLNLMTLSAENFGTLFIPEASEVNELKGFRGRLAELAGIFNLPLAAIQQRVAPFISKLEKAAEAIPPGTKREQILKGGKKTDQHVLEAILSWSANRAQLAKITTISEVVSSYNARRTELLQPITAYQKLINDFLRDSGKQITFDTDGFPHVQVDGVPEEQEIASLSSGEGQVFVILSQLSFNPLAQKANVFIIDEPELSLHVRWQELFVDSIMAANNSIQYILSTHSPSIILERTKNCIDLSFRKRSKKLG